MSARRHRVLIIVQNLPVPFDRRVWMECTALRNADIGVSVICPKGPGDPWRQVINGVRIYKYAPPPEGSGLPGYALEFGYCWLMTALLSVLVAVKDGFGAIQACNPPDTYWLLAALWRPFGKRFVYDQHDLNPEVLLSRFDEPPTRRIRLVLAAVKWLERMTYRCADRVIATNESYKAIAMRRGRRNAADVAVVRSGPDTAIMRPLQPMAELRKGRRHLAAYVGIMGPQDGVDLALFAFAKVVHEHRRTDCHFALLGFGDCFEDLRQLSDELNLSEHVTFTGRVGQPEIADYLSTAALGICPDPKNPLNDVSTMNKTMEYMAYGVPVVSFDLTETRVSAGEAARYVRSGDLDAFARTWIALLDDADERVRLGVLARERVSRELDWAPQAERYVRLWTDVLGIEPRPEDRACAADLRECPSDARGRRYIDLNKPGELACSIRSR